jgi:hypothetical protein
MSLENDSCHCYIRRSSCSTTRRQRCAWQCRLCDGRHVGKIEVAHRHESLLHQSNENHGELLVTNLFPDHHSNEKLRPQFSIVSRSPFLVVASGKPVSLASDKEYMAVQLSIQSCPHFIFAWSSCPTPLVTIQPLDKSFSITCDMLQIKYTNICFCHIKTCFVPLKLNVNK